MQLTTYLRQGAMPVCNRCKKDMGWWNPFMKETDYECSACMADRISDAMIKSIQKQFLEGYEPIMDAAFDSIHAAEALLTPISQPKNS